MPLFILSLTLVQLSLSLFLSHARTQSLTHHTGSFGLSRPETHNPSLSTFDPLANTTHTLSLTHPPHNSLNWIARQRTQFQAKAKPLIQDCTIWWAWPLLGHTQPSADQLPKQRRADNNATYNNFTTSKAKTETSQSQLTLRNVPNANMKFPRNTEPWRKQGQNKYEPSRRIFQKAQQQNA